MIQLFEYSATLIVRIHNLFVLVPHSYTEMANRFFDCLSFNFAFQVIVVIALFNYRVASSY